ncbi:hypothetical protein NC652_011563 [Populus alba x Populus x berolinensis]|nr:hypothetical protein NC652_011563 [Populus alba x Populus x berolinensis]
MLEFLDEIICVLELVYALNERENGKFLMLLRAVSGQALQSSNQYALKSSAHLYSTKKDEEREELAKEISKDWRSGISSLMQINYPFEKGHLALVFLVSMHSDDIILGRNVVLHANSVKLFVLHRQSPSRLRSEKMEAVGLRTEACPIDAIVEGPNFKFTTETHEELLYDKEKVLDNGVRWETEIVENLRSESLYRIYNTI